MADECFDQELQSVLSKLKFSLKEEQKQAIEQLYHGHDVVAVLPTGFGKSLIFQALVMMKRQANKNATILVISPLRSLIEDQIQEVADFGILAASLPETSFEDIKKGQYQIIYSSPECALNKEFLSIMKDDLYNNMVAVVIDESHTIETWTGRRKASSNEKVFRKDFGELAKLRSFCKEGTPFLALTGTADDETIACITTDLMMKSTTNIFVSPERKNILFTVKKVENSEDMFAQLDWLIDMVKETAENCPKTLIFCNTLNDIATIYNHLLLQLGSCAYSPPERKSDCCLIGMFHSNTFPDQKRRILQQLKGEGKKRVVIASSALSMGVNFPDIRYVINWGPARNLLDQLQESGRGGRDGKQSHSIIYYHGRQLSHCKKDVKTFVRSNGCLCISAYIPFDKSIKPLSPKHDCCSYCRSRCLCNHGQKCHVRFTFDSSISQAAKHQLTRPVTEQDKKALDNALRELEQNMTQSHDKLSVFDQAASHGFSNGLIEDIVKRCNCIFKVSDITSQFPVFSRMHALNILEIINDIFGDIPDQFLEDGSSDSSVENIGEELMEN